MKPTFRFTLLALTLWLPAAAQAATSAQMMSAYDAYRSNNLTQLQLSVDALGSDPLHVYPAYWLALKSLDRDIDAPAIAFLAREHDGVLTDKLRVEWLKKLGKRQDWGRFENEWKLLPASSRDEESQCYADVDDLRQGRAPAGLDRFLDGHPAPDGCTTLIATAAGRGLLDSEWLWRRVRLLLANNYLNAGRTLAAATGLPLTPAMLNQPLAASLDSRSGQESFVYGVVGRGRLDADAAARLLSAHEAQLTPSERGFAWGQLALLSARKLQADAALAWFDRADRTQLTREQWDYWARSALRIGRWATLRAVIGAMPPEIAAKPAWQYWLARVDKLDGQPAAANARFAKVSMSRDYYGLLALEELGTTLTAPADKTAPANADFENMLHLPALKRALALYQMADSAQTAPLRGLATIEWRHAMRGRSDMELLAAAEIASKVGFYDMAIYSAEQTRVQHDFTLRYLMPYREITQRNARQLGIDDAWVYGLIRQESRFVNVAQSGVGASGLMQLMPRTAHWIAQKMGLSGTLSVNDVETNIQLGTWYLKYVMDSLSGSPVLATAAYNAGPSRARGWQGPQALEGAVYIETIPFKETRNYVQKVMANAAFYSMGMGHASISLKTRLGVIPPR
ncbi:lytic transglycosylase domain-containing protein [Paludibacterium yongneupense]|uniref:lytic transglycosylase domain-containing protein n=1 Tax=Paludibacterium yongneupense TaxID=400061 RepID=UPI000425B83A|nr:lytic transglycosylase domain-containing protein [Paludibacterium yongneupense]